MRTHTNQVPGKLIVLLGAMSEDECEVSGFGRRSSGATPSQLLSFGRPRSTQFFCIHHLRKTSSLHLPRAASLRRPSLSRPPSSYAWTSAAVTHSSSSPTAPNGFQQTAPSRNQLRPSPSSCTPLHRTASSCIEVNPPASDYTLLHLAASSRNLRCPPRQQIRPRSPRNHPLPSAVNSSSPTATPGTWRASNRS